MLQVRDNTKHTPNTQEHAVALNRFHTRSRVHMPNSILREQGASCLAAAARKGSIATQLTSQHGETLLGV